MTAEQKLSYQVEPFQTEDRPRRFLEAFAAILKHSNYGAVLDFYTRVTAKCSRCTAACQVYQASGDPRDIPCHRSELLLRVYRRYFTLAGEVKARLYDSFVLTDDYIDEMAEEYWRCTACKRCKSTCPMGIDHAMITHLARWILAEIGIVPKAMVVSVREQLEGDTKNTSAIPAIAMKDTCEFLEEEIEEEYPGAGVKFPMDVEDAEYVFFPAVSDYLMEAETLMGNAAMLHVTEYIVDHRHHQLRRHRLRPVLLGPDVGADHQGAGRRDQTPRRQEDADRRMRPRIPRRQWRACRTSSRRRNGFRWSTSWSWRTSKFLSGELKLKKNAIKERTTYHDPCNIARKGWIIEQPRVILRHICEDFVEMTPRGMDNYCCGGGGGTVSIDEIHDFRMAIGGKTKADQLRRTGAYYVVTPCANCKKQTDEIIEAHGLEMQKVGLHDLMLKAIEFEPAGTGGG